MALNIEAYIFRKKILHLIEPTQNKMQTYWNRCTPNIRLMAKMISQSLLTIQSLTQALLEPWNGATQIHLSV